VAHGRHANRWFFPGTRPPGVGAGPGKCLHSKHIQGFLGRVDTEFTTGLGASLWRGALGCYLRYSAVLGSGLRSAAWCPRAAGKQELFRRRTKFFKEVVRRSVSRIPCGWSGRWLSCVISAWYCFFLAPAEEQGVAGVIKFLGSFLRS